MRPSAHGPAGERIVNTPPEGGRSDVQRGGRATVRDRLGDRRSRAPGDDRATAPLAGRPRHAARPAQARRRRVVPRVLAGDLRRRSPCPRRVHLCDRPEPGACPAVRDPVDLRDCGDTEAADRALARLSLGHGGRRARRAAAGDRAAGDPSCPGRHAEGRHGRVRDRGSGRAGLDPRLRHAGNRRLRPSFVLLVRRVDSARARVGVRARLHRSLALLRAVRRCRGRGDPDRPSRREQRSVAELLAIVGVALAGAATARARASPVTPHRPRRGGSRSLFDWVHLAAGSIWIGGLIGLLVLWRNLDRRARRRSRRRRPAILEHRLRVRDAPHRVRDRRIGPSRADRRVAVADLVRTSAARQDRAPRSWRCSSQR